MRRPGFTPILLCSFAVTVAFLSPQVAHAADPVQPIQLVRPGDGAMTCEALAAEINTLATVQMADAAPVRKKKKGFGFLKALGSVAAPVLTVATGGMGGMIASQALGAASMAGSGSGDMENAAQDQMASAQRMAAEAMAGGSIAQQRKDRLTTLFTEKRC